MPSLMDQLYQCRANLDDAHARTAKAQSDEAKAQLEIAAARERGVKAKADIATLTQQRDYLLGQYSGTLEPLGD